MRKLGWIGLFACLLFSGSVRAEEKGESISIDMHGRLLNQYFFRGLRQSAKGVGMQGGADMRIALYDEENFKFQTIGGAFLSFHPGDTRGGDDLTAGLIELRGFLGLGVLTPYVEVNGLFYVYVSPNQTFEDVYELDLYGRFKDDALWAAGDEDAFFRGFFPQLTLAQEVSGARDGQNTGTYLEVAMAPTLRMFHNPLLGLDFVFPMSLGMSLNDYYQIPSRASGKIQNHFLGYAAVGFLMDFDERWVPDRLGGWHGKVGMDVLFPRAQKNGNLPHVDTAEFVVKGELALNF